MDPFSKYDQPQTSQQQKQQQEAIFAQQEQKQKQQKQSQQNQFQQSDFTVFQQFDKQIDSQTVEQNEQDMLKGNILEELSIQPKMILKKLYYSLPFTKIPEDVAHFPEMSYCLILVLVILILTTIKKQTKKVPIFFGMTIYGTYVFKLLISLLNQGQKSVDAFYAASAISYGLTPIIIMQMVSLFVEYSKIVKYVILLVCAFISSMIMSKHILSIILTQQQRLIIFLACYVYCILWILILL